MKWACNLAATSRLEDAVDEIGDALLADLDALGSVEALVSPGRFALGAGAGFFARAIDTDKAGLGNVLQQAHAYDGASFTEIFQNCIVYNKDVFDDVVNKKQAADTQIHTVHGEPLIYGKERDKGLRLDPKTLTLASVNLGEDGITEADLLVHDETNPTIAQLLLSMSAPLPTAMGVIHRVDRPAFDQSFWQNKPTERRAKVLDLLRHGNMLDRRAS